MRDTGVLEPRERHAVIRGNLVHAFCSVTDGNKLRNFEHSRASYLVFQER